MMSIIDFIVRLFLKDDNISESIKIPVEELDWMPDPLPVVDYSRTRKDTVEMINDMSKEELAQNLLELKKRNKELECINCRKSRSNPYYSNSIVCRY